MESCIGSVVLAIFLTRIPTIEAVEVGHADICYELLIAQSFVAAALAGFLPQEQSHSFDMVQDSQR